MRFITLQLPSGGFSPSQRPIMASLSIKDEGIDEPSLDFQESPISFRRSDPSTYVRPPTGTTKISEQPLGTDPRWKLLVGDLLQQCINKEKAAETGVQCLSHLIATFKAHDDPSLTRICQLWVSRIGMLYCMILYQRLCISLYM